MKGGRLKPETNNGTVDSETVQKILVVAYGKPGSNHVNKIIKVINVDKTNYADENTIMTDCDDINVKPIIKASNEIETDLNISQTPINDNAITVVKKFDNFVARYNNLEAFDNNSAANANANITVYCLAGVIENKHGKRSIVVDNGQTLLNFKKEFSTSRNDMFTWNDNQGEWTIV